jgi:hypothetical protein
VNVGRIIVGESDVPLGHLQVAVTQQALSREHVATVPQILNGEGVTESMRVHALHASPFRNAA